jgi:hypothetical protein
MTPRLSKALLTSHITFSTGWLGAVVVFLVLAISGLTSRDINTARSAYHAMELSAWFVILPFCLISLFTGILQATLTKWGLFRHYWIVVKLFLTLGATVLLLLHMRPISYLAGVAADPTFSNSQHSGQVIGLIAKAGASIVVLIVITTISVYKPWGKIQLTKPTNNQFINIQDDRKTAKKSWKFYALIALIGLVIIFIIMHLFGGGMHGH